MTNLMINMKIMIMIKISNIFTVIISTCHRNANLKSPTYMPRELYVLFSSPISFLHLVNCPIGRFLRPSNNLYFYIWHKCGHCLYFVCSIFKIIWFPLLWLTQFRWSFLHFELLDNISNAVYRFRKTLIFTHHKI